jgi:HAD superfamily hydrolase (TIGR01509 family)
VARPRALLFDLDGTLVDTDTIHLSAWQEILGPHGFELDADEYRRRISGRLNNAIVADYFPKLGEADARRVAARKEAAFREAARRLEPIAGLVDLLARARASGLELALVTNAPAPNVQHMLDILQLADVFDIVVLGDQLPRGKPDPLPYAHALQQLEVPADAAFAFEDSISGVRSAKAAGLRVAGITTTQPAEALAEAGADPIIADFTDPELLRRLAL